MSKYEQDSRDPISSEFAFETFSKAGFKPNSAICEIIDNSIEANAKNITIKIEWQEKPPTRKHDLVGKFIFIDDGDGMDEDRVYDYFVATESTKRNNTTGIGKFGVGAYLSCISQAKIGEVYSKTKNGKWMFTTLRRGEKIPKPKEKEPPNEYVKFDHGTIIVWDEVYSNLIPNVIYHNNDEKEQDNLSDELGRIYRKFLTKTKIVPDEGCTKIVKNNNVITIQIETDSKTIPIIPYDPLFYTYNRNIDDKEKPILKSQSYKLTKDGKEGYMYVTFSYLPKSWWLKEYRPGISDINTEKRQITRINEGISIVREGRELYFGTYPGGPIKLLHATESPSNSAYFEERDRWTGIEIEFKRNADDIFGVEFNKTRINMEKYARKAIAINISDTIMKRRREFSRERDKLKNPESPKPPAPPNPPKLPPGVEGKLRKFAEQYKAKHEKTEEVFADLLKGYHISLDYDLHPENPFVTFDYEGNAALVRYNMSHPYMRKLSSALKMGEEKNNKTGDYSEISDLIGMLIASYGFSRRQFSDTSKQQKIEDTLEDIISVWTKSVRRLSREESE